MNADEIVRALKEMLPPQVDYAELVGSPVPSSYGVCYVWEDPEPYHISAAIDLIESLQAQLSESQRREKAAVEEIEAFTKARMQQLTLEQALVLQPVLNRIYTIRRRGPQEAGEVSYQNVYDTSKRPQQAGEERE